jgi:hypothetical protein
MDVLVRLGWLAPTHVDHWRQSRVDCLERMVQANLSKVATAMTYFRQGEPAGFGGERDRLCCS